MAPKKAAPKKAAAKKSAAKKLAAPTPKPVNRTDKTGSSGMGMTQSGVKSRAQAAGDRANTNNALNPVGQADMRRRGYSDKQIASAIKSNVKSGAKAFDAVTKKYGVSGLKYQPSSNDRTTVVKKKKK
jgi:hypothetical protein